MVLERAIRAPRAVVWGAWTDPGMLPRWWGPDGFSCRTQRIDLRAGGEWVFDMIAPDGTVFPNHHRYHEVRPDEMIGYTLQPGRDPDLFSSMGLQAGDVVTRVNDVALSDLSSGMRALKSAQGGDSVTLTVMRGGQEETLSINVPQ
jgi:uncharacterized protein YndB with AHSA1/START domain